jgi:Phasin protein
MLLSQAHAAVSCSRRFLSCAARLRSARPSLPPLEPGGAVGAAGAWGTVTGLLLTRGVRPTCTDGADAIGAGSPVGRIEVFLQCHTPQDFAALQAELLRDNMETVFSYARKAREHSTRGKGSGSGFGGSKEIASTIPGIVAA